jgi:integrase
LYHPIEGHHFPFGRLGATQPFTHADQDLVGVMELDGVDDCHFRDPFTTDARLGVHANGQVPLLKKHPVTAISCWTQTDERSEPVSRVRDRDIYEFRQARTRHSARAVQLRNQARKLRATGQTALGEAKEREALAEDRKGTKPSTVNRDLRTVRAMLKQARPDFRFPGGAFYPEDETHVRWLRPEEEILLLDTMTSPFREIAKLAALTLMRQGEIRYLRRESVHLQQGVVMLPRAKAGARPVVLSAEAQKILKGRLEAHESEWVFPGPDGRPYSRVHVSRVFRKASRAAGSRTSTFTICDTTARPWP